MHLNIQQFSLIEPIPTPLSPTKGIAYNTIDNYKKDMICLSENSLEYDLYISSLKEKLIITKAKNLKRKIFEFQKEEQKSLRQ